MKSPYSEVVVIPSGIECSYSEGKLTCKKGERELSREIFVPGVKVEVKDDKILFSKSKSNKSDIKKIRTFVSHIKNMFKGTEKDFVYRMEICFVHFPITVKVDGRKFIITNFLGEKKTREADICEGVNVEVKGKDVIVSGKNIEITGQTVANIEKATNITKRDRRVFQDGIFLVEKNVEEEK